MSKVTRTNTSNTAHKLTGALDGLAPERLCLTRGLTRTMQQGQPQRRWLAIIHGTGVDTLVDLRSEGAQEHRNQVRDGLRPLCNDNLLRCQQQTHSASGFWRHVLGRRAGNQKRRKKALPQLKELSGGGTTLIHLVHGADQSHQGLRHKSKVLDERKGDGRRVAHRVHGKAKLGRPQQHVQQAGAHAVVGREHDHLRAHLSTQRLGLEAVETPGRQVVGALMVLDRVGAAVLQHNLCQLAAGRAQQGAQVVGRQHANDTGLLLGQLFKETTVGDAVARPLGTRHLGVDAVAAHHGLHQRFEVVDVLVAGAEDLACAQPTIGTSCHVNKGKLVWQLSHGKRRGHRSLFHILLQRDTQARHHILARRCLVNSDSEGCIELDESAQVVDIRDNFEGRVDRRWIGNAAGIAAKLNIGLRLGVGHRGRCVDQQLDNVLGLGDFLQEKRISHSQLSLVTIGEQASVGVKDGLRVIRLDVVCVQLDDRQQSLFQFAAESRAEIAKLLLQHSSKAILPLDVLLKGLNHLGHKAEAQHLLAQQQARHTQPQPEETPTIDE
eukprot:m.177504 g.177504  ORF g.177504 m.177504 type:complete len:551 (+) comp15351_c0_seq1:321-1973(+)